MFYNRMINLYKLLSESGVAIQGPIDLTEKIAAETSLSLDLVHDGDKKYELMFKTLIADVITESHQRGVLPRPALRPLLELIELYFNDKMKVQLTYKFSDVLLNWAGSLSDRMIDSRDNVLCLYGQVLQTHQGPTYLVEILIDCLDDYSSEIDANIAHIARWLCTYDASFIVNCQALYDTYASLKVGPAFALDSMRSYLRVLPVANPRVKEGIELFLKLSQAKVQIDTDIMRGLAEIYRLRWLHLIDDSELNYLGNQQGDNAPWIRLAQLVCGAGWLVYLFDPIKNKGNPRHFNENYYRFLMPTIMCDTDPIQLNGIANYALSHLILSHSGRYLILLDTSVSQFISYQKFYNWNTRQPKPFTDLEIARMSFSRFKGHVSKANKTSQAEDIPISKQTLQAVRKLVMGSFYNKGLHDDYDESQMVAAGIAYHHFYSFLKQLPLDERRRLLNQRVRLGKQNMTVDDILYNVEHDGCIAGSGELLTKLLLDYNPYEKLGRELEERLAHNQARLSSELKVYSDYNGIDTGEAKRRILILATSIMSQRFDYSLTAETMLLWDCSNSIAGPIKNIFKLIKPMIEADNFRNARHVYAMIIESIAKPALISLDESWYSWLDSNLISRQWLRSLVDETLFKEPNRWFHPNSLLATLSANVRKDAPVAERLELFLDELVYTYLQPQSDLLKELRVNILFAKLLYSSDPLDQQHVLEYLKPGIPRLETHPDHYIGVFLSYVIYRLGLLANKTGYWRDFFFSQPSFSDLKPLINSLKDNISSLNSDQVSKIKTKIDEMGKSISGLEPITNMLAYLLEMFVGIDCPRLGLSCSFRPDSISSMSPYM